MIKKTIQLILLSPNLINLSKGFHTPRMPFNHRSLINIEQKPFTGINPLYLASKNTSDQENNENEKELNKTQLKGIKFGLSRNQVEDNSFNEDILRILWNLKFAIPKAKKSHIYKTAMKMKEYQIHGYLKYNLSLKQVGIIISGKNFILQDPKDSNFSEETIKTLDFLWNLNLGYSKQDNYKIAINFNLDQLKKLILYGIPWRKVLKPHQLESTKYINLIKYHPFHIKGDFFKLKKKQQYHIKKKLNELYNINAYPNVKKNNNITTSYNNAIIPIPEGLNNLITPTNSTHKETPLPPSSHNNTTKPNNNKNSDDNGKNEKKRKPKR